MSTLASLPNLVFTMVSSMGAPKSLILELTNGFKGGCNIIGVRGQWGYLDSIHTDDSGVERSESWSWATDPGQDFEVEGISFLEPSQTPLRVGEVKMEEDELVPIMAEGGKWVSNPGGRVCDGEGGIDDGADVYQHWQTGGSCLGSIGGAVGGSGGDSPWLTLGTHLRFQEGFDLMSVVALARVHPREQGHDRRVIQEKTCKGTGPPSIIWLGKLEGVHVFGVEQALGLPERSHC
ncbi:hypothetical protein F5148DRAFT_1370648 [Russula earlei]|uniref:Uncharacterized protein n=1 Tax=Russula earlei TaxID=71964 RepID=A0ACC0TX01_9AGAM|nr:hypothetical protein F5148DRAFT_1370648 [Russula earlei]